MHRELQLRAIREYTTVQYVRMRSGQRRSGHNAEYRNCATLLFGLRVDKDSSKRMPATSILEVINYLNIGIR